MTAEELLERYAAGERDFSGITILAGNLIKAELTGINLSNATLSGTSFIGAILDDANLSGIYMDGGDFTRAELFGANLYKAMLDGCDFIGANLREANMSDTMLGDACLDAALFYRANLTGSNMRGSSRCGTNFKEACLQNAVLESGISAANFTDANLLGARDFAPSKTDIICRTTMPDGSVISV
ncbi:pentapeptide repeat-containing protein [Altericista sp. CCNU0014]|uniref:pentapeptide repeat-containing protein n=1 Tax=Altericista sp. CCNU0014 TaxID=3082949 RepID=UPI00384C99BE